jgi:hypothetical protein
MLSRCSDCQVFLTNEEASTGACPFCGKAVPIPIIESPSASAVNNIAKEADVTPLPRPLQDPLRFFRKLFSWSFIFEFVLVAGILLWFRFQPPPPFIEALLPALLSLPGMLFFWRILPNRVTNAFYLRSFRNDRLTWPIRKAAQAALGRQFRLSGIRDPSRRSFLLLRWLAFFIFVFRYSTPKFMNLEAGSDWKGRLWRSLAQARCALIDLLDLTVFVKEEILLAYQCLGPKRLLFIGDGSRSSEQWQSIVAEILGRGVEPAAVNVAIWQPTAADNQKAFSAAVQTFAAVLPKGEAGLQKSALPLIRYATLPTETRREAAKAFWLLTLLGILLGYLLFGVLFPNLLFPLVDQAGDEISLYAVAPMLIAYGYLVVLTVNYMVDCGVWRERVATGLSLTFLLIWAGGITVGMLGAVQEVKRSANDTHMKNNLKIIGLLIQSFQDYDHRKLPPWAITDKKGAPLLGWRVAILPFLGEENESLYKDFNLDEAWDSPHNRRMIPRIPKFYQPIGKKSIDVGLTYYRVFVGTGTLFEPGKRIRFLDIAERVDNIVMVVEAAEPVIWTKPEELTFDSARPLPKLGGLSRRGFYVLFADGWPRILSYDTPDDILRGLITRNGGKVVNAEDWER